MNLAVKLGRSLQADMQAELRELERAAAAGTKEAGRGLNRDFPYAGLWTPIMRCFASSGKPPRARTSP